MILFDLFFMGFMGIHQLFKINTFPEQFEIKTKKMLMILTKSNC